MSNLEIEVKFFLKDIDLTRQQIQELNATFLSSVNETNIRYETEDCGLFKNKSLLRLRQADRVTLTYKSEPPEKNSEFKVHQEYEVTVDDFEMMKKILVSLGFHPEQIYEKHRESYQLGNTTLCLDTMPYGNFLEIEGPAPEIRPIAERLGLSWEKRILANYLAMFEWIKSELGLSFSDITFDNFEAIDTDLSDLIARFEAFDETSKHS